jgi:lysophospholipase L1-like esterase
MKKEKRLACRSIWTLYNEIRYGEMIKIMNELNLKDCINNIQRLGRTYDGPNKEIFMNWTCSGLKFRFKGSYLVAEMNALSGEETDSNPFDGTTSSRKTWPFVAVFVNDKEEPEKYFEVKEASKNYLIFSSEKEEIVDIIIRKMTENPKGKLSISKFFTDGKIETIEDDSSRLNIEFIGDSITCGFGNLSNERDRLFYSADENGWLSHAAVAARKLAAKFSIISYSGISITKGLGKIEWKVPSMTELYPYTDRLIEEEYGMKDLFEKWEFKHSKPDVIVLNLGTNDATVIDLNEDISCGIDKFEDDYYQFLEMLREKNGVESWIICALGSMDYYLFDSIQKVAERFARENKDSKIRCFKYGRIRITDGQGACGHPNLTTQIRMGNEIADYISKLLFL